MEWILDMFSPLLATIASVTVLGSAAVAYKSAHKTPTGKGVFVRTPSHGGSPSELVDSLRRMGIRWVAFALIWQRKSGGYKTYQLSELPAYVRACQRAGIRVWVWAYPVPGRADQVIKYFRLLRKKVALEGLILDPEGPYYGVSDNEAAIDVRKYALLDTAIGMTSYGGGPALHPGFPWRAWSAVDFGIPQVYDPENKYSETFTKRWIDSWRAAGYRRIVPAFGAYRKVDGKQKVATPERMLEEIKGYPERFRGCIWWDLYWLELSPKAREVVRRVELPPPIVGKVKVA